MPVLAIKYDTAAGILWINGLAYDESVFSSVHADRLYRFEMAGDRVVLTDCGPLRPLLVRQESK